jgi:dihydropteroate synthase
MGLGACPGIPPGHAHPASRRAGRGPTRYPERRQVDTPDTGASTHRLFVTGQLAKEALERALSDLKPDFRWRVEPLRIKVAALMTTRYLKSTLSSPDCDRVYLPGLCQADTQALEATFGVPFSKGPKDLRDLPEYFGGSRVPYDPDGEHALTLLAEINDVHALSDEAILLAAERYRGAGADVIDLGCSPEHPVKNLGRIVRLLRDRGFRVSVDTFNEDEALSGDAEGAEFLLSLNAQNMHLAGRLHAVPVVIAEPDGGVASLLRNVQEARDRGAERLIADAVLDPIHFGFSASIRRFCEAREALTDVDFLMGVGNLTELTGADSAGVNALLLGIMSELDIRYALTTEVAPWALGSVREIDCGRRIMHHARHRGLLPKGFDSRLVTARDVRLTRPAEGELRDMKKRLTDRNLRIETDGEAIFAFNKDLFEKDSNIRDLFSRLHVDDPGHAFYLGRELMKADLARHLGKKYIQGEPLHWGYLTYTEPEATEPVGRRGSPARRHR